MNRSSVLLLLLPLLSGCGANLAKEDPRLGHPINVEMRDLHADLAQEQPDGLSDGQIDQLRRIAGEAQRRAAGAIVVSSANPVWAHKVAEELRHDGAAQVVEAAGETPAASIDLPVWQAKGPDCGDFGVFGLNPDYDNAPNLNWGCSMQHNIAAMVQNPADLVRARQSSGRDGNRSVDVLDKYGKGAATGSAQEAAPPSATTGAMGGH